MKTRGFTLIELVVVIVLLGIVGTLTTSVIIHSVEGYDSTARRERLQSTARLAIERIQREIRQALPNSVCTYNGANCNNSATMVYFLNVKDAGRYQDQSGSYGAAARAPLPVSPASANSFDVASGLGLQAAANDWVVVYNLDNSSIYSVGNRRKQINAISAKDIDGDTIDDLTVLQFAVNESFPQHSPNRRFHVIEGEPILFFCQAGNLYRATSSFANPSTPTPNTSHLLMENVESCSFTYDPGSQHRAGLLRIELIINEQGERVQINQEAHVYNVS